MPLHITERLRSARSGGALVGRSLSTTPPREGKRPAGAGGVGWVPWPAAATGLLALLYVLLLARLLPVGIDNLGIAAVFSTDEALSGRIVRAMVDGRTLSPSHFFSYGALYHEAAALLLLPFSWLDVSDRAVLLSLRAVALASGVATILLTQRLGARLYGPWAGVLAAALLATSPELVRWSITAHPDTLQLALITGGLIAVVAVRERPAAGRVTMAALLAGLAFGTKYGGVLLLPVIVVASACALIDAGVSGRPLLRRLALHTALTGGVFVLAFVLTNPYAVVEWRRFLTQFQAEIEHARAGHVFDAQSGPWNWIRIVASPQGIGLVAFIAAAADWVRLAWLRLAAYQRPQAWWRRLAMALDGRALIAAWTIGYLVYLIGFIGLQEPRYALPALPGIAVSAAGLTMLLRRYRMWAAAIGGLLLLVVTLLPAVGPLREISADRLAQQADGDNPRVAVGRWLAESVRPDATVLADAYVYLPPSMTERTETFGLTAEQVQAVRPVLIVVNDDIRGRFRDGDAERYVDGADAFGERERAYAALESGQLGCYRLLRDFGSVRVYGDAEALRSGASRGCGAGSG